MLITSTQLLTTQEVARRLGVKPATVYAYVSRGRLKRDPASGHRRSLFAAAAVERLAAQARRPHGSNALEVVIETQLTALDPSGRLSFRGRDAGELARFRSFEEVAVLLWDGPTSTPWELAKDDHELMTRLRSVLPSMAPPVELIPVVIAALAAADPGRADRRPEAVRRAGARMLAGILTVLSGVEPSDRSAAARLWAALQPDGWPPTPAQLAALNAALVLLADHELAASTLAARVAASAWADPYRVVLAGLGPLGGTLHGGAAMAVQQLLSEIETPAAAFTVIDGRAVAGGVPGLGHRVYRDRDPRADHLLERLDGVANDRSRLRVVRAALDAAAELKLPAPNVDFALAALADVSGLHPDAPPVIFTTARIVGLIAHALEEYPHRQRFRPRARYVGPVA
jgi:citrate synthase